MELPAKRVLRSRHAADIKRQRDSGKNLTAAAHALGKVPDYIEPYWSCALNDELLITDPKIFPVLYFEKGAVALHALRLKLGDDDFYNGFRNAFTEEPGMPDY